MATVVDDHEDGVHVHHDLVHNEDGEHVHVHVHHDHDEEEINEISGARHPRDVAA